MRENEYRALYRKNNPKKIKAINKKYREKHRAKINAYNKQYRSAKALGLTMAEYLHKQLTPAT